VPKGHEHSELGNEDTALLDRFFIISRFSIPPAVRDGERED